MDALLKHCCPNCSQIYQLKSPTQPKRNIPLFLSCGHSMCETCIKSIIKFDEPIECRICHRDTKINSNDIALMTINKSLLYQLFPINLTMLGELFAQSLEHTSESNKKSEDNHFIDLQALLKTTESTQGQCLECHGLTSKMCKQCATILCDACFNKSHKNFVIFKNHVLKNIEPVVEPNDCKIHKGKPLDYYCKDCSKAICMDCLVVGGEKSCKNHNVVSIQEVNESFIEQCTEMAPKVDEIFRRLTKTAVDIGGLLNNIENETGPSSELTNMLASIEQHFSKLIFAIQTHKKEVTDIIVKLKCSEKESLMKSKDDVANAIKKAKITLNAINSSLDTDKVKQINFPSLIENAKSIINTPWYLTRDESNDPLKVAVNEDLCALINDYIHLEGNANTVYKLRSTSELSEDVEIPPPPPALVYPPELTKDVRQNKPKTSKENTKAPVFYKNVPKYRSKSNSVSSLNSADSDCSQRSSVTIYGDGFQKPIVHQVQPFEESKHPKQLVEGTQELIYITHIVDPHNFFVQRACHQNLVKEMMREFRNAVSLPKPSINHVTEGKWYLVFNKADNTWQRCRVVTIDRRNLNNPKFHVFCIDFGSNEEVYIDQLRLLPPARVQSPFPLAINCSLANIKPKTGSWSSDDAYLIQNIVDNKQIILHVRHVRSTSNYTVTLECDITTFDYGISLAHALAFHERAHLINPKLPYPMIAGIQEKPKIFMSNNDFKQKSIEEVYITSIVSPDKFYVRKRHFQNVFEKLSEDLEHEYSLSVNSGSVYLPEIGMVCVVNVERYKCPSLEGCSWARAVVLELPGRGRVRVLLVDSGATLLVHWAALRHIQHKFTTLNALATECHLAGVTPLNKKWSHNSVALLEKYEDRLLELHVEDTRRGSVGVTLYDKADEDNIICINNEMIKYKFAISFGLFKFNKNTEHEDQGFPNKTPLDPTPQPKPKKDQIKILKKPLTKKIDENELEAKDKGPLRLEAKILHYQSPSLLYVSLIHQQKAFNDLYEKIQKHYSKNKTQGKDGWIVGDRCCTFCNQSQTWRRALIVDLEGENAKVFYSDFACSETVPIASLRELTQEFSMGDAAIKCHLCGVVSAHGEDWPTITKEYLKELLDAYPRVFITKLGNFKDNSMPIELWVYHTIQGGALEPNKSEWRCLNKKIIEQGLAVPDKSQQIPGSESLTTADDDMLSFLKNVTGSVREWLQLEPLPTTPLVPKPESDTTKSTISSPGDSEDVLVKATESTSNTVFISDWLPPDPLQSDEFAGMPTYIDNEGLIYLHDINQQDTLDLIRKALDQRFKLPDPKAKYAKWVVGEPCIALFFLDNRFYRGRVLEVNEDNSTCLIHYVDYGNEEICSFENLRKSIALYQIAIQAHKCVLSRIAPVGGVWDRQTLDYIHKSVVEKLCYVKVTGDTVNGITPIELKYDKLWINDHLVEFEMATYTDGSKAVVRKFAPKNTTTQRNVYVEPVVVESDSGPDYIVDDEDDVETLTSKEESIDVKSLEGKDWNKVLEEEENQAHQEQNMITFPKNDIDEFICNITVINDLKVLQLNICHDEETNVLYEDMYDALQRESINLPPLKGVYENKACVALFHEDGQWYRASILQYSESENRVKVKYVDYGNIDVIPVDEIKEINEEWTTLPPATVAATLYGVEVNPELDISSTSKAFAETFLDKGPFQAKVIQMINSMPYVELRNDEGNLVYENLLKSEVLTQRESSIDQ